MAFLEQRGHRFRVIFRHGGRRYTHTLKTTDESSAQGLVGGIEKTPMLLDQKVLKVPEGVEVLSFIVSNDQVENPPAQPVPAEVFEKLLEKAPDQLWRTFLLCAWWGGLRLSEARQLQWESSDSLPWIDFEGNRIVLPGRIRQER